MTLQELEQLKEQILTRQMMNNNRKSARITVGMGTCGIKAGALAVIEEIRQEPAYPPDVVITHVGCQGLCSYEPVMEVACPQEPVVTYGHVTPEMVKRIVREHIIGGNPVKEWVLNIRKQ